MRPAGRTFAWVCVLSCGWAGGFLALSRSYAPKAPPKESEETANTREHFENLAAEQRRLRLLAPYYGDRHVRGMIDAVVEFRQEGNLAPRMPRLDGFQTRHVNVLRGEDGVIEVLASYMRPAPYELPRSIDVGFGDQFVRADLDQQLSSHDIGWYRIEGDLRFEMKSPHGRFRWVVSKDKDLLTSPACLFRQDLYRDGDWITSLLAVSK